jgi:hypothetical protein
MNGAFLYNQQLEQPAFVEANKTTATANLFRTNTLSIN